jgi:hypothetical protein
MAYVPLSFTAIRVPPLQFFQTTGVPKRLINSDLLSGCGGCQLPSNITSVAKLFNEGTALIDSIANSAINQLQGAINSIVAPLNQLIGQATGGLASDLTNMLNTLTGSAIGGLHAQIGDLVDHMPSVGAMVSAMGPIQDSLSMSLPDATNIYGPLIDGTLNGVLAPTLTAMNNITGAVTGALTAGVESLTGLVGGLTSGFTSALSAALPSVNSIISGITGKISSIMTSLGNLSNASAILGAMVCGEGGAFSAFMNTVASPALKALLPAIG